MDRVKIEDMGNEYSVIINGRPVDTRGYEVSRDKDNFALITLYANSDVVLEEEGDIDWVAMPRTIEEAIEVLAIAIVDGTISSREMTLALGQRTMEIMGEREHGNA